MKDREMKTVTGIVETTAQNSPERFGVKIDDAWFDGWGVCPDVRGKRVTVTYSDDGRFKRVQQIETDRADGVSEVVYKRSGKGEERGVPVPPFPDFADGHEVSHGNGRMLRCVAL